MQFTKIKCKRKMDKVKFIENSLLESAQIKQKIFSECAEQILKAVDVISNAFRNGKKLLLCGNGGSAADSQHIATEFVIRLNPKIKRPGLPAIAITTDTSNLTAGGNDIGFENTFARTVEALGNTGDVLIGISTSGNSENVIRAVKTAKEKGMTVIGFLGRDGGRMKELCDIAIIVPSNNTQRIQEGHITIGHIISELVEIELYGEPKD